MSWWRERVVRIMRVPPEPDSPPGSGARVFRSARNFLRYKLVGWGISQLSGLVGLIFAVTIFGRIENETIRLVFTGLEVLGWAGYIAQLPFSLGITILDYEMRWYIVTDRSLRIREGIVRVKEKTMTFANIQNIMIRQGPLQRMLGIADVEVRNAGGGGASDQGNEGSSLEQVHVGYFRGLDNAQQVRDIILEGVRKQRSAGLGDHDDHEQPEEMADDTALVEAANELLAEARSLRRATS